MNPQLPVAAHAPDPNARTLDPYRVFFPLGVIAGLVGVAIWPLYALGWIDTVRSEWHIDLQLNGFLMAFVVGFLMTAVPRFTLSFPASPFELWGLSALFVAGNIATAFGFFSTGRLVAACALSWLIVFCARRFLRRKGNPPDQFLFVGAGLLTGFVAEWLRVLADQNIVSANWAISSRRMIPEGMVLMLVLGIGGKLAPLFWGHQQGALPVNLSGGVKKTLKPIHVWYALLALSLAGSFVVEYEWNELAGLWLRALSSSAIFIGTIGLLKKPKTKGVLVRVLQLSLWLVAISPWGAVIHPQFRVDVLHVMFVGGFGVLILTIATRVILSHGGYPTEIENKSKALLASSALLVIAMVLRAISSLLPEHYFQVLGLAGGMWIAGLVTWGIIFSSKAMKINVSPVQSESC